MYAMRCVEFSSICPKSISYPEASNFTGLGIKSIGLDIYGDNGECYVQAKCSISVVVVAFQRM